MPSARVQYTPTYGATVLVAGVDTAYAAASGFFSRSARTKYQSRAFRQSFTAGPLTALCRRAQNVHPFCVTTTTTGTCADAAAFVAAAKSAVHAPRRAPCRITGSVSSGWSPDHRTRRSSDTRKLFATPSSTASTGTANNTRQSRLRRNVEMRFIG